MGRIGGIVVGLLALAVGGVLAWGGLQLVLLGGTWYYGVAGIGTALVGGLLLIRRAEAFWLYCLVLLSTAIWALWEVGFAYWSLFPRIVAPLVLFVLVALVAPALRNRRWIAAGGVLALALFLGGGMVSYGVIEPAGPNGSLAASAIAQRDWGAAGGTPGGTRFAPAEQITPANVASLQVAWKVRTGDLGGAGAASEATPLQIGERIYTCTPNDWVIAVNAETGKVLWRYDPQVKPGLDWRKCRGVSYFHDPAAAPEASAECADRVILNTIDARLIALDAITGQPCSTFGNRGTVDLRQGMGEVAPGMYFQTSPPAIGAGRIIVGGWVWDNGSINEPGGVIRAFDAVTGKLSWAWDPGNPAVTREPVKDGHYTYGTPNSWSLMSVDEKLGMVYLPTGNATPDFFGGHRTPADDQFSSSVVALDLATGRLRWKFQTVHHDVWDYDVGTQPMLYDLTDGKGGSTPALVQLTKQGQIFVLDRRTGKPIRKVEERPVPQGNVPGDWRSPTQPFSTGMPAPSTGDLTEAGMWGITPLDQLWCRLEYKKARYEGMFTPPTTVRSLYSPGAGGGYNWGGGAIDERRGYLIVNDLRVAFYLRLIPRAEFDREGGVTGAHLVGKVPQAGTPYGAEYGFMVSPLGLPCNQPPFGTLSAIDLANGKIVWQRPAGTIRDVGPVGMKTGLPFPVGTATIGGPLVTGSGLMFYSAAQDAYVRAFDVRNGSELWKARLPVGSTAAPMSYTTRSGRQFVLVTAGGAAAFAGSPSPERGDYLIAYALPGSSKTR